VPRSTLMLGATTISAASWAGALPTANRRRTDRLRRKRYRRPKSAS
jgi:hypothetical protein